MSALIHHFVVHRLILNKEDKIQAIPRDNCLAVTPEIELLAHQINHSFNSKPGKGVGHFVDSDDADSAFADGLKAFLDKKKRVVSF
ncbi:nucleoid-associated protein [Alteromonas sp. KUL49]|uniref:nucleoid-associated protein n=1 Tax=Alteromonas sp. KUL49 TaxID=2480798 RepID=UPI0010FFBC40|nr:nucleoid-associated protein [Alteromonas sp. KUL49]GEA11166.1 hypothetical protein KUL49_15410 [Alteromonas sp. KUL49]